MLLNDLWVRILAVLASWLAPGLATEPLPVPDDDQEGEEEDTRPAVPPKEIYVSALSVKMTPELVARIKADGLRVYPLPAQDLPERDRVDEGPVALGSDGVPELNLNLVGQEMTVEQAPILPYTMIGRHSAEAEDTVHFTDALGHTLSGEKLEISPRGPVVHLGDTGSTMTNGVQPGNDPGAEQFVYQQRADGGSSYNVLKRDGTVHVRAGQFVIGEDAEAEVSRIFCEALIRRGIPASIEDRGRNAEGEDRYLSIEADGRPLQIVTGIIDQDFCRGMQKSTGAVATEGMATWILSALESKKARYERAASGLVLLIDFRFAPLMTAKQVVDAYRQELSGELGPEVAFAGVHLVGDDPARCATLYTRSGSNTAAW